MSKVIEMLKEKGIAERIQRNVDRSVALFGEDAPQEAIDKAVEMILDFEFHRDPELSDAFAEYAYNLAMKSVVKELGIKYNPDSAKNLSDFDKAMYSAVDRLVKTICPF